MNFFSSFSLRFIGVIIMIISSSAILLIPPKTQPHVLTATSANNFSNHFFPTLLNQVPSKNVICSPLSVYTTLTTIAYGAEGDTKKELVSIANVLEDKLNSTLGFRFLLPLLYHYEKTVKLNLINRISIDKKLTFNPKFVRAALSDFDSDVQRLDFSKPEEAAKTINDGYEERTYGRFRDFINSDDLNGVKAVLVSSTYFSGEWIHKFPSTSTKEATFHISKSECTEVNMMHVMSEFNHGRIPGFNANYVELHFNVFKGWSRTMDITMFVIRPDSFEDLEHIRKNFENINTTQLNTEPKLINVYLPKFKIESKFDLKSPLNQMGINKIFDDSAELNGIVANASLKIDKFIHKVSLEVQESGTNSNILVVEGTKFTAPKEYPEFRADVPFICIFLDKSTKTKLFMALVMNPNENEV